MMESQSVLLIDNDDERSTVLKKILDRHAILRSTETLPEFNYELEHGMYEAVFCGWSFHNGTWIDVLRQVQQRSPEPPLIVFFHSGGEREWVKVLEAGAFDLLAAPYSERTVMGMLEHAISSYEGRRLHCVGMGAPMANAR